MELCWIYITTKDRAQAELIGRQLVEERLCACANILDGMRSFYWWQGAVHSDQEAVLILKTRAERVEALTQRVKELHSYKVPCVVALPILGGNPEFLRWIEQETR